MKRMSFIFFILYSLFSVPPSALAAESQTWKLRPGDSFDTIATTLEIPREEIKKQNPGVSESNLQIGQRLKLPLRSFSDSKLLDDELRAKEQAILRLERQNGDLGKQITNAESQLRWHPVWLWGFWIFFGIIAFIASGAFWIFRQTHPRVFEEPHDRSIADLEQSQIRVRSSFPDDNEGPSGRGQWQPTLRRSPYTR